MKYHNHRSRLLILLTVICCTPQAQGQKESSREPFRFNRPPLQAKPYAELPLGNVRPGGWLERQLRLMADGMTGHLDELYPSVVGPRNGWLGGDGDGWERGPYWIDGLLPLAHLLQDRALLAKTEPWIEWTLNHQTDDGYLGPVPFETQPANEPGLQRGKRRDWWPKMVMLKILQNHYSATGDPRVIAALDRYFRFQLRELPKTPLGHWSFWGNRRGGDNIAVVLWLYNITGEAYLLELAALLHQQTFDHTGTWLSDDSPLRRRGGMHCVNIAQGMKHPIVYSQVDGKDVHLRAVRQAIDDLDECFGHPTGLYGADEPLNSKRATTGSEFCTAAEMLFSLEKIAEITGDVPLLDRLERIAFNVLPTQANDDFSGKQYYSTVNQVHLVRRSRRAHLTDHNGTDTVFGLLTGYPCCLTNLHQAWPKFTQHLWMASADDGLAALYYAPCRVTTTVAGKQVTIEEQTDYPFEDVIRMNITTDGTHGFPIHLRIPTWCDNASVKVNGESLAKPEAGKIAQVHREWKSGDEIELQLPGKIKTSRWHNNSVALERGSLVFALRIGESWRHVEATDGYGDYTEVHPTTPWNYGLLAGDLEDLDQHFTLVRTPGPLADNPWNLENAPLRIEARGTRIPQWEENMNHIAGELSISPVKVDEGTPEPITLIPYGCSTLRITEFPLIGDGGDTTEWISRDPKMLYEAKASHCFGGDTVDAIGDSLEPNSSDDHSIPRLTFWNHKGTSEWCEAHFDSVQTIDHSAVYWFDDTGRGQCRVPKSWRLFYQDGNDWKSVETKSEFGVQRDQFNTVSFDPVTATALRIEIQLQDDVSAGILEWRVGRSSR